MKNSAATKGRRVHFSDAPSSTASLSSLGGEDDGDISLHDIIAPVAYTDIHSVGAIVDGDDDDNLLTDTIPIPDSFFHKQGKSNVFHNQLEENHAYEQFFWTENVVNKLKYAINMLYMDNICGLMTPSLIHSLYLEEKYELLLDIDRRFQYLPKYYYYDVMTPYALDDSHEPIRILVIDPPFFHIPIEEVAKAVNVLTNHNYNTKILIAFIIRGEKRLRKAFKEYNLYPTTFQLEYSSIKSNKWRNFCLYSNIDLPGIKRIIDKPRK